MKRFAVVLTGLLFAASVFAAAPAVGPVTLPEGVLGVVEVQNLTQITDHVQAFGGAITPDSEIPPMSGPLFLWLGYSTDVAALDTACPLRLFLVKGDAGRVAMVRAFVVKDVNAYRQALLPSFKPAPQELQGGEAPAGVERYVYEKREFDREAFQMAEPEERGDINNFIKVVLTPLDLCIRNNIVCIGPPGATAQVLDLLSTGDAASKAMLPAHDVAAALDVQGLLAQLKTEKGTAFQSLREKAVAGLEATGQPPATLAIIEAEMDALDTISAQVKMLDASADITAADLNTAMTLTALPETELARYMAGVPVGLPEGLKYIPQDCWVVAAMRMGEMQPLLDWSAEFQKRIALAMGQTPEQAELAAQGYHALQGCYGDQFAMGLRSGPGMRIIETIRLKDLQTPAKVEAQVKRMGSQFYGGMMEMKIAISNPIQHNGKSIGEWIFSFGATPDPNAPPDPMKDMQRAMLALLLGDPATVNHAVVENDWLISAGPDALKSLKNILDEEAPPVTQLPSFQALTQALPPQTQGIALLHLTELVNWAQPFLQQMGGIARMLQPPAPIARGPGIVMVLSGTPTSSTATLTLPAAEIRALVDGFKPPPPPAQ